MCYQRFVNFTCGCGSLEEDEPCDFATHPFTIRLECPDYTAESYWSASACGPETSFCLAFFCAKSKDAEYIRDLQHLMLACHAKCTQLKPVQDEVKEQLDNLIAVAQAKGIPYDVCKRLPLVIGMDVKLNGSIEQCNTFAHRGVMLKNCIREIQLWYHKHGGPHSPNGDFCKAPSFVDTFGRRIASSVTSTLLDTSRSATPTSFRAGDNIVLKPHNYVPPTQNTNKDEEAAQRKGHHERTVKQETPVKRARKSVSPAKSDQTELRRSSRITRKNINYEESDESSPKRGRSPGESDVSGFNPSRSESSGSPERSETGRKRSITARSNGNESFGRPLLKASSSMASKISEYRARLNRTTSPGDTKVSYDIPASLSLDGKRRNATDPNLRPPIPYQIPQVPRAFAAGSTGFTTQARPPTRHGPPTQHQVCQPTFKNRTIPAAMPNFLPEPQVQQSRIQNNFMQTNNAQTNPSYFNEQENDHTHTDNNVQQRNNGWLIGTPEERHVVNSGESIRPAPFNYESLLQRHDSARYENMFTTTAPPCGILPTESPYERLRRSFSAAADLTPPATFDATPPTTDPKKRKQSLSSPLQSNKRPRLIFPGDEDLAGTTFAGGTPPKSSPPSQNVGEPRPTPAPNFAPTAVMYRPSLKQRQATFAVDSFVTNQKQPANSQPGDIDQNIEDALFDELIDNSQFSSELPGAM